MEPVTIGLIVAAIAGAALGSRKKKAAPAAPSAPSVEQQLVTEEQKDINAVEQNLAHGNIPGAFQADIAGLQVALAHADYSGLSASGTETALSNLGNAVTNPTQIGQALGQGSKVGKNGRALKPNPAPVPLFGAFSNSADTKWSNDPSYPAWRNDPNYNYTYSNF